MTDLFETTTKSIPITKDMVPEAYRKVRAKKGSAGVDNAGYVQERILVMGTSAYLSTFYKM